MTNNDDLKSLEPLSLEERLSGIKPSVQNPDYTLRDADYELQESYRQYVLSILRRGGDGS